MLENFKIEILYKADGKKYHSKEVETEHYTLVSETGASDSRLKIDIKPKAEIELLNFAIIYSLDYLSECKIFANGFQSWTECKEYDKNEIMNGLSTVTSALKFLQADKYGDYTFKEYMPFEGAFHGYTYAYLRRGKTIELYGSLNERTGYTIFNFDVGADENLFYIEKEVEGLVIKEKYSLIDMVKYMGSYDEVFDRYFTDLKLKKPRFTHKTGYTSWYNYYANINEQIIERDLKALSAAKLDIFQIDDGWQTAVGDWLSVDAVKFPKGMKYIADSIHQAGMQAGLWLAPFSVGVKSELVKQHPDWLMKNKKGKPYKAGLNWGGFYALDFYKEEVRSYLKKVFDTVLKDWGYDMVKLDFLYCVGIYPQNGKTRASVMFDAMEFLRECIGEKMFLGCGVPLAPAFGNCDFCRIGPDMGLRWGSMLPGTMSNREIVSTSHAVGNAIFRRGLDGRAFVNDPDVFLLRENNIKMDIGKRKLLATINRLFGNLLFISDNVEEYTNEQKQIFDETMSGKECKVTDAEFIDKNIVRVKYVEEGKEKSFAFNIKNGKLTEGQI